MISRHRASNLQEPRSLNAHYYGIMNHPRSIVKLGLSPSSRGTRNERSNFRVARVLERQRYREMANDVLDFRTLRVTRPEERGGGEAGEGRAKAEIPERSSCNRTYIGERCSRILSLSLSLSLPVKRKKNEREDRDRKEGWTRKEDERPKKEKTDESSVFKIPVRLDDFALSSSQEKTADTDSRRWGMRKGNRLELQGTTKKVWWW